MRQKSLCPAVLNVHASAVRNNGQFYRLTPVSCDICVNLANDTGYINTMASRRVGKLKRVMALDETDQNAMEEEGM